MVLLIIALLAGVGGLYYYVTHTKSNPPAPSTPAVEDTPKPVDAVGQSGTDQQS